MLCGQMTPHEITPLHLRTLHDDWKRRLEPATISNRTYALRHLIKHIAALTGRPDLPDQVIHARRAAPRTVIATPAEIDALVDTAPRWMKVIVLLASNAGLRRSDCLQCAPAHYNAEKRTITLRMKKTGDPLTVPVTDRLAAILEDAPTGDPLTPFYALYRDKPITTAGLDHAWNALKKKAGVNPNLWLHDLRRTLAVSMYEISKDIRIVEQLLGHRSLASTAAYLEHRDPAKLKPYLDALWTPKGPVQ